jgi:hypothetical protein
MMDSTLVQYVRALRRGELGDYTDDSKHGTECCTVGERLARFDHLAERMNDVSDEKLAKLLSSEVGEQLAMAVQAALDKLDYS